MKTRKISIFLQTAATSLILKQIIQKKSIKVIKSTHSSKMLSIRSLAGKRYRALIWRLFAWSFQLLPTASSFKKCLKSTTMHSSRRKQMAFCKFFSGDITLSREIETKHKFQYQSKNSHSFTRSG